MDLLTMPIFWIAEGHLTLFKKYKWSQITITNFFTQHLYVLLLKIQLEFSNNCSSSLADQNSPMCDPIDMDWNCPIYCQCSTFYMHYKNTCIGENTNIFLKTIYKHFKIKPQKNMFILCSVQILVAGIWHSANMQRMPYAHNIPPTKYKWTTVYTITVYACPCKLILRVTHCCYGFMHHSEQVKSNKFYTWVGN